VSTAAPSDAETGDDATAQRLRALMLVQNEPAAVYVRVLAAANKATKMRRASIISAAEMAWSVLPKPISSASSATW
jgi:hypothetical protein